MMMRAVPFPNGRIVNAALVATALAAGAIQIRNLAAIVGTNHAYYNNRNDLAPSGGMREESRPQHSRNGDAASNAAELERLGVRIEGPYESWPADRDLPCYPPDSNMLNGTEPLPPTDRGFVFLKTYKTGSSTASGINLRIARNVARRRQQQQQQSGREPGENFDMCKARFDHTVASKTVLLSRDLDDGERKLFLWSIVRDPATRAISWFYFFKVMEAGWQPSAEKFVEAVRRQRFMVHDHYLRFGFLPLQEERYVPGKHDPVTVVNNILSTVFLAVTERMEESAVVLAMLLNIPLADVLFLTAKVHSPDDTGSKKIYVLHKNQCYEEPRRVVSAEMKEFLESEEWQRISFWDKVLHEGANQKLDLTIAQLGRDKFEQNLRLYQKARRIAQESCGIFSGGETNKTIAPCLLQGKYDAETTDCLWGDSACGMSCLDMVSSQLNLW